MQKKDALQKPLSSPLLWRPLQKSLLIDLVLTLFFIILILILSVPSILFFLKTGDVSAPLMWIGAGVFVPVAVCVFFIREFSFFYFLLSPLRLRGAIEASCDFFIKYRVPCITFGLSFLIMTLLFTFLFNLVMLSIVALFQSVLPGLSQASILFVFSLLFMSWYAVLRQALSFSFFSHFATPKETPKVSVTDAVFKEKVSEIPSA